MENLGDKMIRFAALIRIFSLLLSNKPLAGSVDRVSARIALTKKTNIFLISQEFVNCHSGLCSQNIFNALKLSEISFVQPKLLFRRPCINHIIVSNLTIIKRTCILFFFFIVNQIFRM